MWCAVPGCEPCPLPGTSSTASSPTWPPRAPSSTPWSPPLEPTDWRTPTPGRGLDVAHQIAHLAWTDEVGARSPPPTPTRFDAAAARGAGRARRLRRPAPPPSGPRRRRPSCSTAWRAGRAAPRGRAARPCPAGAEARLVRAADEPDLDGHRPADGDLGARPGRRRRARRRRGRPPTGCGTSPTSASAPATSPSWCTTGTAPAEPFRVELVAPVGRAVDVGPGRRRPSGSPGRRSTSACSSPSAATAPTSPCVAAGPDADALARHRPGLRRAARAGPAGAGDRPR